MNFFYNNHDFKYEMDNICRLFLSYNQIQDNSDDFICTEQSQGKVIAKASIQGKTIKKELPAHGDKSECERIMAVALYKVLENITGKSPPWGILTGIRPVKLMRNILKQHSENYALDFFKDKFLVNDEKVSLCRETMINENKILRLSTQNSFSLYISIPFCPTRCSYCSFVSHSIEKTAHMIPEYITLLCQELRYTADIVRNLGLKLETVYVGGGTPTTLSASQLTQLLSVVNECFETDKCREFTVEAGRPDTITFEKLVALQNSGVNRISINPQTMNDTTLKKIGRAHNTSDTLQAFETAKTFNFDSINADLIAGLPDENLEDFQETLNKLLNLSPNNITIHTLAIKRASFLNKSTSGNNKSDESQTNAMLNYSRTKLSSLGYKPYYLYRQSNMIGNLENVGWTKPHKDCMYNVYIMDETHSIIACGAGAVTKIRQPLGDRIERIFNYKYPFEYRDRFSEILKRKDITQQKYLEISK